MKSDVSYLICCFLSNLFKKHLNFLIILFHYNIFRYEAFITHFLHKTANDCFFHFWETCVYPKIRASTCLENLFIDSPQINWEDLLIWLWILIKTANLENDVTNQIHCEWMGIIHGCLNFNSQLRNRRRELFFVIHILNLY